MHVFICALPASGHLNPLLAIGRALQQAGHSVTVATGTAFAEQVGRAGFQFAPLSYPPEKYEALLERFSQPLPRFPRLLWERPQAGFFFYLDELTAQTAHYLRTIRPDVVLCDFNFYAGGIAAEAVGLPYAHFCAIVNPLPSRDTPTFGANLPWRPRFHPQRLLYPFTRLGSRLYLGLDDRAVNRVRRAYGLRPVSFPIWSPSPYLFIVPTTEAYEYPRRDLPRQAVYVGNVSHPQRGETPDPFPWEWLGQDPRPTVYASLGTIVTLPDFFHTLIQAAQGAPWKAVLAIGRRLDPAQFDPLPPNILLRPFVPQLDLLPKVEAVVSHGGNNTVTEALLNGKPLVVIPITGDQPESAGRVVKAGAGVRLNIRRLTPRRLRRAIDLVLTDPRYRAGAQKIRASEMNTQGLAVCVRLLERLAQEKTPLQRPHDLPPTLRTPAEVEALKPAPHYQSSAPRR
jgi:MGT family glycosyltransferase